jgi:hypothetical protein
MLSFAVGAGILIYETVAETADRVVLQVVATALITGTGVLVVQGWLRR